MMKVGLCMQSAIAGLFSDWFAYKPVIKGLLCYFAAQYLLGGYSGQVAEVKTLTDAKGSEMPVVEVGDAAADATLAETKVDVGTPTEEMAKV